MKWYVKITLKHLMQDRDTRSGSFPHIRPYIHMRIFEDIAKFQGGKGLDNIQEVIWEPIQECLMN